MPGTTRVQSEGQEGAVQYRRMFDIPSFIIDNPPFRSEGFPSGQRDQTVNLTALPSKVRILPPPPNYRGGSVWICGWIVKASSEVPTASCFGVSSPDSGGCSSMVEQKPSKLTTRVRFPSPAPERDSARQQLRRLGLRGVRPHDDSVPIRPCSSVVEHSLGKGEVTSSILVMGSKDSGFHTIHRSLT